MNDAELMASAYALYAQNLAAFSSVEKANLIGQIQNYFNTPTVSVPSSVKSERGAVMDNGGESRGDDGVRPACRFCGKTFAQASYIKAHERLHTGEKPYCCSVCSKPFSDASNWKKHERMHARQIQTAIEEGVLPLVTSAEQPEPIMPSSPIISQSPVMSCEDLSLSMKRMKPDPMALVCRVCGKVFSTPASLSMHKKIHSGERPHSCSTCGKSFTQIGTLRAHERVHTGEKPYECKFCGKTFAQCGSYRMHERRHRRDMMDTLQNCYICAASFESLEELQNHMLSHPGALPPSPSLSLPSQVPLNFSMSQDSISGRTDEEASEPGLDQEAELGQEGYQTPPKSAPASIYSSEHFQLPPFAATAQSLIQRSLSAGSHPNTAVSLYLASNGVENGITSLAAPSPDLVSPVYPPVLRPDLGPPPKSDNVEEVSTTTRSRKYSSDSHTSLSLPDGQLDQGLTSLDLTKNDDEIDGANGLHSQKTPSEDSSLAESRSNDDFQSDDQHSGISRQNLNRRMISSTNPRKQRHPMRRLSASGSTDADTSEKLVSNGQAGGEAEDMEGEEDEASITDEMMEKISRDQMMVSFLLSRGKVYKCEHCRIIFEDCTLYLLHNGFHSSDKEPFKCVICKKLCSDRVEFNCHLTSHVK